MTSPTNHSRMLGLPSFLYGRFVYRHHMRFIHKRGRHQMKHVGPLLPDGGEFARFDWCGHTENFKVSWRAMGRGYKRAWADTAKEKR